MLFGSNHWGFGGIYYPFNFAESFSMKAKMVSNKHKLLSGFRKNNRPSATHP
jgi:hypothetical protein